MGAALMLTTETAMGFVLGAVTASAIFWFWVRPRVRRHRLLERAVEAMPVPMMAVDATGDVAVTNAAARSRLGVDRREVRSGRQVIRLRRGLEMRPVADPGGVLPGERQPLERALHGEDCSVEVVVRAPIGGSVDGTERRLRMKIESRPLRDSRGRVRGAVSAAYDLTELHESHLAVTKHHNDTELIADSVRAVLSRDGGPDAIIRAARSITFAVVASLFQPDGHGDLVCTASTSEQYVGMRVPVTGDSAIAHVHNTGRPVWSDHLQGDPRVSEQLVREAQDVRGDVITSGAWYPIVSKGRGLAVLTVGCPAGVEPPRVHAATLDLLASETAMALAHQELVRELERRSLVDPLTGVANRRGLELELARSLPRALREERPVSVLVIDLDHFKGYNDAHGHVAGDSLLRAASAVWQDRLRPGDLLCRWGGEEFAVLLPGCALSEAVAVAEHLRALTPTGISCSIGVAEWDRHEPYLELLGRADVHLYAAKAAGRNRVHS